MQIEFFTVYLWCRRCLFLPKERDFPPRLLARSWYLQLGYKDEEEGSSIQKTIEFGFNLRKNIGDLLPRKKLEIFFQLKKIGDFFPSKIIGDFFPRKKTGDFFPTLKSLEIIFKVRCRGRRRLARRRGRLQLDHSRVSRQVR